MHMAIDPSLRLGRLKGPNETGIAVRQVGGEEVLLLLNIAEDYPGLAKVSLCVARRMAQRHEDLPPTGLLFAHVILDDRIATP